MVRELTRAMKDSGVEWIGEIPEDWEAVSLDRVLKAPITDGPHETPEYLDDGIPFISVDSLGFGKKTNLDVVKKYISEEDFNLFNKKTKLEVGDILFTKAATIGKLAIVDKRKFMVWSPIAVIKINDKRMNSEFIYNVFNSNKYISHVTLLGTSNTQVNVGMRTLEKAKIPYPPKAQQKAIADFLDKKIKEIDNIISKTKKAIEEYKKYKQSLITETVTKGLDKNVPMKDSGIEWIGDIPKHWDTSKVKYEFKCLNNLRDPITADKRINKLSLYNYYGASGIIDKIDDFNVNDKVLLIAEDGANLLMRNLPLVYKAEGKFWVNNHAHILKPYYNNDYDYMAYLLEIADYDSYITGSAQPKLTQSNIMSFGIIRVPLEEQQTIAKLLNEKCGQIDNIILTKEKLITEMENYKKSLIYETVTGKREVE